MSDKIKVGDIWRKHMAKTTGDLFDARDYGVILDMALKEIVEAVIDKCVEESPTIAEEYILSVKKMIDYE